MNERIRDMLEEATEIHDNHITGHTEKVIDYKTFAELIIRRCIAIAANQRNPTNLNYKPSERLAEDLRQHFGIK